MMKNKLSKVALALVGSGSLTAGALVATAGTAGATYGKGADYQVEISANPPGEGFWFWSELMTMAGSPMGTYQETDCLHLGGGHTTDAAAHDTGTLMWKVTGTTLVMTGVHVIGGLETVTISVPLPTTGFGKASSVTFTPTTTTPPLLTGTLPAQVEIAP